MLEPSFIPAVLGNSNDGAIGTFLLNEPDELFGGFLGQCIADDGGFKVARFYRRERRVFVFRKYYTEAMRF